MSGSKDVEKRRWSKTSNMTTELLSKAMKAHG